MNILERFGRLSLSYQYKEIPHFPHLLPADTTLWRNFIKMFPDVFDYVFYDIRVGLGCSPDPEWPDYIANMAKMLTQRRIDVVAFQGEIPWLIELKFSPGVSVIGQLWAYQLLLSRDISEYTTDNMLLIADKIDEDLAYCLLQSNIKFIAVPFSSDLLPLKYIQLPPELTRNSSKI